MKGCLIAALIVTGVFGLVGVAGYHWYHSRVDNFPDHARRDFVYAQYGELIGQVQAAIDASESRFDLAARLEKIDWPEELVYLTLTRQSEDFDSFEGDAIKIIDKIDVSSSSYTLIDGSGHGSLNGEPVIVINLPVDRHSIEDCHIYLRIQAPAAELPSTSH